jgi:hypothetical protein
MVLVGRRKGKRPGVDRKKILKQILTKHDGLALTASICLRMEINMVKNVGYLTM